MVAYTFEFKVKYTINMPKEEAEGIADDIADNIDEYINNDVHGEHMDVFIHDSVLDEGKEACPECGSTNFDEKPDFYHCNDCLFPFPKT